MLSRRLWYFKIFQRGPTLLRLLKNSHMTAQYCTVSAAITMSASDFVENLILSSVEVKTSMCHFRVTKATLRICLACRAQSIRTQKQPKLPSSITFFGGACFWSRKIRLLKLKGLDIPYFSVIKHGTFNISAPMGILPTIDSGSKSQAIKQHLCDLSVDDRAFDDNIARLCA